MSVSTWHNQDDRMKLINYPDKRKTMTPEEKSLRAQREFYFYQGWKSSTTAPLPDIKRARAVISQVFTIEDAYNLGRFFAGSH